MKLIDKAAIGIVILSLLLGASILTRGHEWGDDFASYIMQAQGIWEGKTTEFVDRNSFTIHQSSYSIGPVAYPWGYPLLLTPFYAIYGRSPLPLKIPGLIFYIGFLICLYIMTKSKLTRFQSLLFVSLFAFNPIMLGYLDHIISDIPFLFFSTLGLLLTTHEKTHGVLSQMSLGAVFAFAFFLRTTGILLLLAFAITQAAELYVYRKNRDASRTVFRNLTVVFLIFAVLWALYLVVFPGGSETYFSQIRLPEVENIPSLVYSQFWLLSIFFGKSIIWSYVSYLFFLLFLLGLFVKQNDKMVLLVFFILWIATLAIWPFWQGLRFVFPLLPIFMIFAFEGARFLINNLPLKYNTIGNFIFQGFLLGIVISFFSTSATDAYSNLIQNRQINGPYDAQSIGVYDFIKDKTPTDSVIIFFKPRALRLMTGHDALLITECANLWIGDYIVISKKAENGQIPPEEIFSCNIPLDHVYENRRFIVYEIVK